VLVCSFRTQTRLIGQLILQQQGANRVAAKGMVLRQTASFTDHFCGQGTSAQAGARSPLLLLINYLFIYLLFIIFIIITIIICYHH
jgi:hypothetical protein